jgi:hypothetical protein
MITIARNWRVAVGGVAAASAAVLGLAGANASADPIAPIQPAPATVTVTVTPDAMAASAPLNQAAAQVAPAPQAAAAVPPPAPTITPATSGTLTEFFKQHNVGMLPQKAAGFTALNLVLPMPRGWSVVPDPNVPDAFTVLADRLGGDGLYTSNAQLTVYKLVGDFDPKDAISHGFIDSQQLSNWQATDASMNDFGGFPSSLIEGTYRENDMTLNTSRRHVIVNAPDARYLVSLFVTTAANQVVATADATDAIVNGFKVTPPAPPAPPGPAPFDPANPLANLFPPPAPPDPLAQH